MRDLVRSCFIDCLGCSRSCTGGRYRKRKTGEHSDGCRSLPSAQSVSGDAGTEEAVTASCRQLVGHGLLEIPLAVEVKQIVVAAQVSAPIQQISVLRSGLVALRLAPGKCGVE